MSDFLQTMLHSAAGWWIIGAVVISILLAIFNKKGKHEK